MFGPAARDKSTWAGLLLTGLLSACSWLGGGPASRPDQRSRFIAYTNFSVFTKAIGTDRDTLVLTSPGMAAPIDWNELVVSWNCAPNTALQVEARALGDGWASPYYNLGRWSLDPARYPRTSVHGQRNGHGEVKTDTLVLPRPASGVQVRLTVRALDTATTPSLRFLGLSFLNSITATPSQRPHRAAWGKALRLPEKGQLDYAGGRDWCSPTCVSMVLSYWAEVCRRPDWRVEVPDAARQIHDPAWGGTGNWSFNTAFAGSRAGLRAYVTRLNDLAEVEEWTGAGVPVVLSVSFDLLHGQSQDQGTGHLIVCVGFTEAGDVIVHDPWAPKEEGQGVRRVYLRKNVRAAWRRSQNTVYLIYPEQMKIPPNRWEHWARLNFSLTPPGVG